MKLWNVASGELIRTFDTTASIRALDFSRDGRTLATAGDGRVQLWDAESGQLVETVEEHRLGAYLYTAAFSPDGSTLAFGTFPGGAQLGPPVGVAANRPRPNQGKIKLWDMKSGKVRAILDGHESYPTRLRYSQDGKLLASSGHDAVKIWNVDTGELQVTLIGRFGHDMAFSGDSRRLAVGERGSVSVVDVTTGEVVRSFDGLLGDVAVVLFAPDSSSVITATYGTVGPVARDLATGQTRPLLQDIGPALHGLQFSADGKTLATAGDDAVLRLWDVATANVRRTFAGHTGLVISISLSADGKLLASSASDQRVILWDVETGNQVDAISVSAKWPRVALSPDGRTLAYSGQQGGVDLYDVTQRKTTRSLAEDATELSALAFSPDGALLAESSYSEQSIVRVWDLQTGEITRRFAVPERPRLYSPDYPQSLAFSPDGKTLAVGIHHVSETEDAPVVLFDVATGNIRHTLGPHRGWVTFGSFSPDGTTVATSSENGQLSFWDSATGALRQTLRLGPPAGEIPHIAFSPDGQHLATANGNGTVYLFNVP